jgi:hypothetical protein
MGIPCPILNAGYTQWVISMFTVHKAAAPPIPPAILPGLVEGPMPMGNPLAAFVHKKAATVLVDGTPGVNQGHDVGYFVPHFALPMNAMCAINTLFSKHKVMFPVSSVQLKGSPAGTYVAFLFGLICCDPVSLPGGVVLLFKCTVWTSPSLMDFVKGTLYIAIDIVLDYIWGKFFKKFFQKVPEATRSLKQIERILALGFALQPGAGVFRAISQGGLGLVTKYMLPRLANKAVDHLIKNWGVSPLVSGGVRGAPSIGRGDFSVKFFSGKPWW